MLGFVIANALVLVVLWHWWFLWRVVGLFGCLIIFCFQRFDVGGSDAEDEDTTQLSALLHRKCLLKLL